MKISVSIKNEDRKGKEILWNTPKKTVGKRNKTTTKNNPQAVIYTCLMVVDSTPNNVSLINEIPDAKMVFEALSPRKENSIPI